MTHTDFLPGIAQSHTIKFNEPSGLFVGLATNPYINRAAKIPFFNNYYDYSILSPKKVNYRNTYEWMIFSPSFSFLAKSCNRNTRHDSPIDCSVVNGIRVNKELDKTN